MASSKDRRDYEWHAAAAIALISDDNPRPADVDLAQVHATLALAAATAETARQTALR